MLFDDVVGWESLIVSFKLISLLDILAVDMLVLFFFGLPTSRLDSWLFYFLVPEDNVERLRNIRDMFENTDTQLDEELQLQKVEKQQPSDKIKDIFLK